MLEQSSRRLLQPGAVHAAAPSKRPELRRAQLVQVCVSILSFSLSLSLSLCVCVCVYVYVCVCVCP